MLQNLKFSHKILIAASLVVIAILSLFSVYNDVRQGAYIENELRGDLQNNGTLTAQNIQSWLSGRVALLESMQQNIERDLSDDSIMAAMSLKAIRQAFELA